MVGLDTSDVMKEVIFMRFPFERVQVGVPTMADAEPIVQVLVPLLPIENYLGKYM